MLKRIINKFFRLSKINNKSNNKGYSPLVRFDRGVIVIGKVKIGDYSFIGKGTTLGPNCHYIGRYCSIGPNCLLGPNNHPKNKLSTSAVFYSESWGIASNPNKHRYNTQKVVIQNDVWLGANVVIVGNVTISNGAIVGANAVVTKDVPPFAIVGGAPAKLIKYRYDEQTRAKIEEMEWWNLSAREALNLYENFSEEKNK